MSVRVAIQVAVSALIASASGSALAQPTAAPEEPAGKPIPDDPAVPSNDPSPVVEPPPAKSVEAPVSPATTTPSPASQPLPPLTQAAQSADLAAKKLQPYDDLIARQRATQEESHCKQVGQTPPQGANCNRGSFEGFRFGSYGRISAATDLRGGTPEQVKVIGRGPRIVEPNYLELELSYGMVARKSVWVHPVLTLAFDDSLFHDTGKFETKSAIRNMFLEAWGPLGERAYSLWVGSRMYRGNDSYLFDEWQLDNQNTVGAGAMLVDPRWRLQAHVGANRLLNPFQFQQIDVANPQQGATTVVQLNRQRLVASTTAEATLVDGGELGWSVKAKLHTEFAGIGSGTRQLVDGSREALPSDFGIRTGLQLGAWSQAPDGDAARLRRFANLFVRYGRGLSAYDELAMPTSFGADKKTFPRASDLLLGFAGGWDTTKGNLLLGAKARRFIDADVNATDVDDGWEYAINARPLARVSPSWFAGADLSYQVRFPNGINPISQLAADPAIVQLAPMVVYSPFGPRAFDRPQIRFVYRAAHLNRGALDQYVPDDIRHNRAWVHYLGVQAEWWFNSSSGR